jgi:CBS domain-containing protein
MVLQVGCKRDRCLGPIQEENNKMGPRVEGVHTGEAAAFLGRFPPFAGLPPADLTAVGDAASLGRYAVGTNILVEDGRPAERLFVIRDGSVELVHEEEVIDILEPGESFGHTSLLTGLAPTFTVRAHEDTTCYLIPREPALQVLGTPGGADFVATTLRERLTRTGHTVHALPPVTTTTVADLIHGAPLFCEPGVTIGRGARLMTEHNSSAILIRDGARISIVTDARLRETVIAQELSAANPIARVAEPAVTVGPEYLAVDAILEMLDAGTDHIVVVGDRGEALGLLSAADLLGREGRSPFALRRAFLRAGDEAELVRAAGQLGQLLLALVDADVPPEKIGRVLTLQADTIAARLVDFSIERRGPAPAPWAWLQLGSAARREFTLGSDQENALAYGDSEDGEAFDAYFERLGRDVNDGLARCGFAPDANEVLAGNRLWRMPRSTWIQVFEDCLTSPDESHLIRATISFDFRHAGGGLDVVSSLVAVLRRSPEYPDFVRQLARSATAFKPPLGFRGSLSLGREGAERGRIDVKRGGAIPIANLARFHALTNGITISPTLDRLVAAQEVGALADETATALREAFAVVSRLRILHHASQIAEGRPVDNLVDPGELAPIARNELREALRVVADAQKQLSAYGPPLR